MLPRAQRHDTHDTPRHELILIRAGHHLWKQLKPRKSGTLVQQQASSGALHAALEIIWDAKRAVRAELKVTRVARSAEVRERFRLMRARLAGSEVPS